MNDEREHGRKSAKSRRWTSKRKEFVLTTEERLEKLEKELAGAKRRSRVMLVVAVMTVAGILLLGAGGDAIPKSISSQEFVLVDSAGNNRASLHSTPTGALLGLKDAEGKTRFGLSVGDSGALLGLMDTNGKTRAMLRLDESGQPVLELSDQDKVRVVLGVNEHPSLWLFDNDERAIWHTS